jgi:hypothetical protein
MQEAAAREASRRLWRAGTYTVFNPADLRWQPPAD